MKGRAIVKRLLVKGVLLLGMAGSAEAQDRAHTYVGAGLSAGLSNYIGDLDDNLSLKFTTPGLGAHFMYCFHPNINIRFNYYYGRIAASDSAGSNADNAFRNLSFESRIHEVGMNVLVKPFGRRDGELARKTSPYLFAGIALFSFNPKTQYNGSEVELQPLGTEGQYLGEGREPYELLQLSIPMGGGILYRISRSFDVGMELGLRKTFTDYLDDVSTTYPDLNRLAQVNPVAAQLSNRSGRDFAPGAMRGDPSNKDWYSYTNISLTYYFYSSERNSPSLWEKCFRFE
jgi:hypothetical protein